MNSVSLFISIVYAGGVASGVWLTMRVLKRQKGENDG